MNKSLLYKANEDRFKQIAVKYGANEYKDSHLYFENQDYLKLLDIPESPFVGHRQIIKKFAGDWIQNNLDGECMLNFASAKYAGGGVQYGSIAQEEDICRNTLLYFYLREFNESHYVPGKFAGSNYLLEDFIIYSKNVPTITPDLELGKTNNYITSAAPDLRMCNEMNDKAIQHISRAWIIRIKSVLGAAWLNDQKKLVLGPWGCGVFQNDPEMVYSCFEKLIKKYGGHFTHFTFLVPDEKHYEIFKRFVE